MGQTHTKQVVNETTQRPSSIKSNFKAKKYLTRIELVSLQYIFKDLKSTFPDGFTCIEPKKFLDHINLPSQVEPAAVLLFKSFSYLGSYPNCSTSGPIPLSFDAFITAFVVLVGRLDDGDNLSETLFFQSLSVLPIQSDQEIIDESPVKQVEEETIQEASTSKGYSLKELGVDFNDLDFTKEEEESVSDGEEIKMLSRDLIELLVFLLWLGESEETDFKQLKELATHIVKEMNHNKKEEEEIDCISYHVFHQWKTIFSPHFFKPIQSFLIKSFTYYTDTEQSKLLPQDKIPQFDQSDILTPMYSTLLSWAIPEHILITKQWTRLYSANQDGFSMNRFESHVFKYPGPTLFIMQVSHKNQSMTLGAYITQPWKQSKYFWGSSDCFLFELEPNYDIYRSLNKGTNNYIYYHHEFGIGFGSTSQQLQSNEFIIYLQNTLQQGIYSNQMYPSHPTFESSRRVEFSYKFVTENIEVFGLGNEKDREKQAKEWKFDQQEAERRSGLNIRQADGELDKELLKMAGIIDEDKRQDR